MKFLVAVSWMVPVILAAPSLRRDFKEAKLFVKFDKTTSETEITVAETTSQILGQSCTTVLNSGPFVDFQISTDLDENGAGNIFQALYTYLVKRVLNSNL